METRSNHVLVGTVTLLLLAAIIGAAFWFSRLSDGENKEYDSFYYAFFPGAAYTVYRATDFDTGTGTATGSAPSARTPTATRAAAACARNGAVRTAS